jgi:hypothetical protein
VRSRRVKPSRTDAAQAFGRLVSVMKGLERSSAGHQPQTAADLLGRPAQVEAGQDQSPVGRDASWIELAARQGRGIATGQASALTDDGKVSGRVIAEPALVLAADGTTLNADSSSNGGLGGARSEYGIDDQTVAIGDMGIVESHRAER